MLKSTFADLLQKWPSNEKVPICDKQLFVVNRTPVFRMLEDLSRDRARSATMQTWSTVRVLPNTSAQMLNILPHLRNVEWRVAANLESHVSMGPCTNRHQTKQLWTPSAKCIRDVSSDNAGESLTHVPRDQGMILGYSSALAVSVVWSNSKPATIPTTYCMGPPS